MIKRAVFSQDRITDALRIKRLVGNLLIAILALYVFRDGFNSLGFGFLVYILTAIAFVLCMFIPRQEARTPTCIHAYICLGIFGFIFSCLTLFDHNVVAGIFGFAVIYANMVIWLLYLTKLNSEEASRYFKKYIFVLVLFGIISALLGVYQTYVDRSILGLATNSLYASEEAMGSGRFVPRATALLGSAQNYGLFVGICFCACLFFGRGKEVFRFIGLIILLAGIVVSGSRSTSACVVIAGILFLIHIFRERKIPRSFLAMLSTCIAVALLGFIVFGTPNALDSRTTQRLFDFGMSDTLLVYQNVLENLQGFSMFWGNGLGYGSWTVAQMMGEYAYAEAFYTFYSSTESYLLQTWLQSGLPGLILLLGVELTAIKSVWSKKEIGLASLLICILVNQIFTPSFTSLAISFSSWPIILYSLIDWSFRDEIAMERNPVD